MIWASMKLLPQWSVWHVVRSESSVTVRCFVTGCDFNCMTSVNTNIQADNINSYACFIILVSLNGLGLFKFFLSCNWSAFGNIITTSSSHQYVCLGPSCLARRRYRPLLLPVLHSRFQLDASHLPSDRSTFNETATLQNADNGHVHTHADKHTVEDTVWEFRTITYRQPDCV